MLMRKNLMRVFFIFFLFLVIVYNRMKSIFYLIFEFCEYDLVGFLSNVNVKFNIGEIKKVM